MRDATFRGRLENLPAWQAVHQAIGYLAGAATSTRDPSPLAIHRGLTRAAEILNQPATAARQCPDCRSIYPDVDSGIEHLRTLTCSCGDVDTECVAILITISTA